MKKKKNEFKPSFLQKQIFTATNEAYTKLLNCCYEVYSVLFDESKKKLTADEFGNCLNDLMKFGVFEIPKKED